MTQVLPPVHCQVRSAGLKGRTTVHLTVEGIPMRLAHIVLAIVLIAAFATQATQAQQTDWVPQGLLALRQTASTKTDFALDHSMLVLASKLDKDNEDLRRVIAGVSGLSVHSYRFPAPWMYDPAALSSVRDEYRQAGWKELANSHAKDGSPGVTNVWLRFENNAISNVAILLAKPNEVDFVVVSGSISPIDLFRLGGHFGIPKIEGGTTVPNPEGRP
jgi:hypothetical protein